MITIENLCKAYNDKILFKNFHLEIPDSRFLVISGESGCGKSTLLNMIGGIETPDRLYFVLSVRYFPVVCLHPCRACFITLQLSLIK